MVDLKKALEKKSDIVFLDIETTGLSRVYDYVTVIGVERDGIYHAHKEGDDIAKVKKILQGANALVTFNGTLFDVKFLQHHFKDLVFPEHHIDLRFLMRRIGYTGGQKAIEVALGLKREDEIKGLTGYEAVVLWHEYRRGSTKALEQLLAYNHADIQGMKYMLGVLLKDKRIQEMFDVRATSFPKATFKKPTIKQRGELPKPKVYAKDLWKKVKGPHNAIIGIDLTGSEVRPSGFAVLHGDNTLETQQINTDDEIVVLCKKYKPLLVSLDSPLGIPKGRRSCFDDDPGRYTYGIMREAERELKRRGVNVYPCLIPSMQRLTHRGMCLAKRLRKCGIKVIESYPGAAQDIMQIPRKHAGLPYLKDGLKEFGMKEGRWYKENVSHDELDAITSAIVGLFYLAGKYEGLGNDKEEYLVIPKI
jgi:predicted nuclease with RNAse H fold